MEPIKNDDLKWLLELLRKRIRRSGK